MPESPIKWNAKAKLDADPAATVALDRAAWEQHGASFREVDDNDGEHPGLATAAVKTPAGSKSIGILDFGARSTYLLVPGSGQKRLQATAAVLGVLEAEGILELPRDLVDLADAAGLITADDSGKDVLVQHAGIDGEGYRSLKTRSR